MARFTAAEIVQGQHECTGFIVEAETQEEIISNIGSFNEEKVYWSITDNKMQKDYRLNEDYELEEI